VCGGGRDAVAAREFETAVRSRSSCNPANEVRITRFRKFRHGQGPVGTHRKHVGDHAEIEVWIVDIANRPWPMADDVAGDSAPDGWNHRDIGLGPEGSEPIDRPSAGRGYDFMSCDVSCHVGSPIALAYAKVAKGR